MARLTTLKPSLQTLRQGLKPATSSWTSPDRRSTTERGYGAQWQKLRRDILQRDHGLCQPCKRAGRVTLATEVDHIRNKAQGGKDNPANLQAICRPCHAAKTADESAHALGAGWR